MEVLASAANIYVIRIDHTQWTQLLKKYVTGEGKVDYKGFLQDKSKLEDYLNSTWSTGFQQNDWNVQEQLAFTYINLYNAHTVKLILQNYPVKSIKDIDGAWTKEFIKNRRQRTLLGCIGAQYPPKNERTAYPFCHQLCLRFMS